MSNHSIQWRVALAAGIVSEAALLLFAGLSIWWFSKEEMEVVRTQNPPEASQIREARRGVRELVVAYAEVLPIAAAAAAAALAAWLTARNISRPLVRLADAAEAIDARTLSSRLPQPSGRDEIARLAAVLNSLIARLERSFHQSTRFAADASHELRTPLSIMRAEIESAIQASPSGQQASVLAGLLEENQRLAAITEKLLMLARADAGCLIGQRNTINFSRLLEDAIEDLRILAEKDAVRVETLIQPDVMVSGDEILLRQVVLNLCDNAIKYNSDHGWVVVKLNQESGEARFSIANSGKIIPEAARGQLFQRFFRIEESRERDAGGAGLGLSLCHEIIAAHAGHLTLERSDPSGTVFLVKLQATAA